MSDKNALKFLALFWMFLITFAALVASIYCAINVNGHAGLGLGILSAGFFLGSSCLADEFVRKD